MSNYSPGPGCCRGPAQRGFAYLWTLLLVAFMGVGLSIASEVYSTSLQREKERELLFIGREFRNAIARYVESAAGGGQRKYPATLEELLRDPRTPGQERYLRRVYRDPMTGKAEWGLVIVNGRLAGIHSLSERAPLKQANFEVDESSFSGKQKYAEWVFTYPADLMMRVPAGEVPAPGAVPAQPAPALPGNGVAPDGGPPNGAPAAPVVAPAAEPTP